MTRPVTRLALVTLPRTRLLVIFAMLMFVLPLVVGIVFLPVLSNAWCQQFELPKYEREFGFRMARFEVPSKGGGTHSVDAIGFLERGGVFATAGLRVGDAPRIYHGFADFCGDLARASDGLESTLDVMNIYDAARGNRGRRLVTLPMGHVRAAPPNDELTGSKPKQSAEPRR